MTDLPASLDNLTLGQLKALSAMIGGGKAGPSRVEGDGRAVIVRARDAGVHYGKLVAYEGRTVWLRDARRLWSWTAREGVALSGVATAGIVAGKSKVDRIVSAIVILDACEIIDATESASATIEAA
jgi:hypothetical protein